MSYSSLSRLFKLSQKCVRWLAAFLIGFTVCEGYAQQLDYKPLNGLCFGPFRSGEQPGGAYPTVAEITQDLGVLKSLTGKIRTYGNESTLAQVPKLCVAAGVDCFVGAWIDTDKTANDQQVTAVIAIATNNYATTKGLIIGNEYLLRNEQTAFNFAKTNLIAYIRKVKAATGVKVGVADGWHIWNNDFTSDLVAELDFVLVHIHPYWESQYSTPNLTIDSALAHITNKFNLIAAKYPGKRIMIGETGWPSRGTQNFGAVPNDANQKRFVQEFTQWARQNNVEYFLFEAFDEPWKGTTIAEGGFGILTSGRPFFPKASLLNLLTNRTSLSLKSTAANIQFRSGTFEGNRYVLEQSLTFPATNWATVTNFTGAPGSSNTQVNLPVTGLPSVFFRVRSLF